MASFSRKTIECASRRAPSCHLSVQTFHQSVQLLGLSNKELSRGAVLSLKLLPDKKTNKSPPPSTLVSFAVLSADLLIAAVLVVGTIYEEHADRCPYLAAGTAYTMRADGRLVDARKVFGVNLKAVDLLLDLVMIEYVLVLIAASPAHSVCRPKTKLPKTRKSATVYLERAVSE